VEVVSPTGVWLDLEARVPALCGMKLALCLQVNQSSECECVGSVLSARFASLARL
jgi:hypothetical protein